MTARCLAVLLITWSVPALAEVYSWVDDDGVIHFTNVPSHPGAKLQSIGGKQNTFDWTDNLGSMRRIHRVDVTDYDTTIIEAARYYALPPAFVKAVIATESAFEPTAVSTAGALGLMQLMPQTARDMQVANPLDPVANIYGGVRYLRFMANAFNGDIRLTAAAYNAGPQRVKKSGGVPNIQETRTYVKRVLKLYQHYLRTWPEGR